MAIQTVPLVDADEVAEIVSRLNVVTRGCEVKSRPHWTLATTIVFVAVTVVMTTTMTSSLSPLSHVNAHIFVTM